jgi:hypothetical protein
MSKLSAPFLTLAAFLALLQAPAFALTVNVAQDAGSTAAGSITPATGKAGSLIVSAKQTAFVRFDLSNPTVIPAAITPSNLSTATLRLYVIGTKPGDLTVHAVTQDWTETPLKGVAAPTVNPAIIATIPGASVVGKHFFIVDVTAAIRAGLAVGGNDFGFAIQGTAATGHAVLPSKEGPGIGAAAQLDIEANLSTDFIVENRPLSTGGIDIFIGNNAGAADTTGLGNTFVGQNSGQANIGGSSNSFYGLNSGASNTSGQLNVFLGQGAGASNTSGSNNNFVGQAAGFNSFDGNANNFYGFHAGFATAHGSNNAFFGDQAGASNAADNNAFFGSGAGFTNASGTQECYFGINAGNKATGSFNSFFGAGAGQSTSTGVGNTFIGNIAGMNNLTGTNNTYVGGNTGGNNTADSFNTFLGDSSGAAAGVSHSIALGQGATVNESNAVVLGNNCSVGIGTSAPNSMLQVNGSLSLPVRTINNTSATGLGQGDYVLINIGTTATVIFLPQPGIAGRIYVVKNRASVAATIGFAGGGSQIEGGATLSVASNTVVQMICDGTNWFKIN